jgi:hypothetical protein
LIHFYQREFWKDVTYITWLWIKFSGVQGAFPGGVMKLAEFRETLKMASPPDGSDTISESLWWDAKGDWAHAHGLVNDLSSPEAMAVHAYLHRKEGDTSNAAYWYSRAGRKFYRPVLEDEWVALVEGLVLDALS